MTASKEIFNLASTVKELLEGNAKYRDSDDKLYAKIISIQAGGNERLKDVSLFQFLVDICSVDCRWESYDSVSRARRKVQEEFAHLRGEKWKQRHVEADSVKDVIRVLGENKDLFS